MEPYSDQWSFFKAEGSYQGQIITPCICHTTTMTRQACSLRKPHFGTRPPMSAISCPTTNFDSTCRHNPMAGLANLYKQNSNTERQHIQYLTCHLRFIPIRSTKLHWDTKSFRPRVLCTCSLFNSLGPIADISVMRLSASWCHFQQCPWDLGSAWAERAGQGEVGGCTRRVQTAWPRLGSCVRSDLVCTGRAISILFGINGVRNQRSHLVGPPFPEFNARFSATAGWHFSRDLTRRLLIGGCGQSHVSAKHGWNYLWEQFWA